MDILDVLMGAKSIDPAASMQQGLTIGQLSNQVQTGNLDLMQRRQLLEMMKDPAYAQAMGSMLGGEAGGDQWTQLFQRYPAAAGPAFTQQVGVMKNMADVGKIKADTVKATTDARNAQLQVLANAADGIANSEGPLMPDKVMTFLRQASYVGAGPLMGDIVGAVQTGNEDNIRAAFRNFSQAGSSMAQRATANEQNVNAVLAPQEFNLKRFNAMAEMAAKVGGEVKQDLQGNLIIVRPLAGMQMPTPPGPAGAGGAPAPQRQPDGLFPAGTPAQTGTSPDALGAARAADAAGAPVDVAQQGQATSAPPAPVAAAGGAPAQSLPMVQPVGVQAALSPEQTAQSAARAKTLESARNDANVAQRAQQIIPALRAELAQGYTGPLAASNAGRELLNFAVSVGALSPEQVQRVGAMRASDALVTELMGPLARQLSQRGSNFAITLVQRAKAGPENSMEVGMQMLNALATDARNTIGYDRALNDYVTKNPADYGLSGWQAPKPATPPPPGKYSDRLPAPSLANLGYKAYGEDGKVYINRNGREWELVK